MQRWQLSSKKAIDIEDVDIEIILVSGEFVYDKNKKVDAKCFIGYKAGKNRPLFITLPQMSGRLKKYKLNQCMSFEIKDEKLLEKYRSIWNTISNIIKK